ncbi:MAG: DUF1599 domain-containing protein [Cytophagales bacterium]|nr:DUF1599 domain-containing protein [Cytophagales bacterium]
MQKTLAQYREVIAQCQNLFLKKHHDYGSTAWRVLRLSTITDQIFINIKRIITIQNKGTQAVADSIESEFMSIVNYAIIALMQLNLPPNTPLELPENQLIKVYDEVVNKTIALLQAKNHDYEEAWREMRVSSMADFILAKTYRIKKIEDNQGKTLVSEGVEAIYQDILNYAVFCLILINEKAEASQTDSNN